MGKLLGEEKPCLLVEVLGGDILAAFLLKVPLCIHTLNGVGCVGAGVFFVDLFLLDLLHFFVHLVECVVLVDLAVCQSQLVIGVHVLGEVGVALIVHKLVHPLQDEKEALGTGNRDQVFHLVFEEIGGEYVPEEHCDDSSVRVEGA